MDMRPSAVLTRALARLGPNGEGWYQIGGESAHRGKGWGGEASTCAQIATVSAAGYLCFDALPYLAAAAGIGRYMIPDWNDAPERTFEDVRRAFVVAIGMAHADEQAAAPVEAVR